MNVKPWTYIHADPWSNCVVLAVTESYSFILFPLVDCWGLLRPKKLLRFIVDGEEGWGWRGGGGTRESFRSEIYFFFFFFYLKGGKELHHY